MRSKYKKIIWPALLILFLALAGCAGTTQETDEVTVEVPVAENESAGDVAGAETNGVTFEGISFTYDPALAGGVSPEPIPAAAEAENAPYWAIYPAHTQFTFHDYVLQTPLNQPRLYVYPVNQYRAVSEVASEQIDRLQQLLAERPENPEEELPFLPLFNASQVIHPQVVYLDFQNGSGVRFLTQYSQAVGPINNTELFYTFQGLTKDGSYYVSAIFPVSHPSLPADASALPAEELSAFQDNFETYRAETVGELSQAQPDSFTPNLTQLDQLAESIIITADPEAEARRSDPAEFLEASSRPVNRLETGIQHRDLAIRLDYEYETQAQLTFPAEGSGPWPTLILVPGAGAQDMDATYPVSGPARHSANFKLLAESLSRSGIAVLRFNSRGVLGPGQYGQYNEVQLCRTGLSQRLSDLDAVIATAKLQPEIDPTFLFLYGWDEGAFVALQAARHHPGLAGLVLQAPPVGGPERLLTYQHLEVGLPFLKAEVDRDGDGRLNLTELAAIPPGPAQFIPAFYIWSPASTPEQPRFQAGLDQDQDGLIEIEGELRPWIEQHIPYFAHAVAEDDPTEGLENLAPGLHLPVLILQGERDGWVPPEAAEALAATISTHATLKLYPYLGHALSLTDGLANDEFGVMAMEPIHDMGDWMHEVVARASGIMWMDMR